MRELYACQLLLTDPHATPDQVLGRAEGLIREWVGRPTGLASSVLAEDGRYETTSGHTATTHHHVTDDGPKGWTCSWHQPAVDDPTVRWATSLALSSRSDGVCATVRIGLPEDSDTFQLRRPVFQFSSPAIVRTLLREFLVSDAEHRTKPSPWILTAGDIPSFVEWLTDNRRALPVVVVTNYPSTGRPLVDAQKLSRELAGLAHVAHLSTHLAARNLTDEVGAQLSAWQGAVRLYWPKFAKDSKPYDHKYWPPHRMPDEGGTFLIDELRRWLGSVSAASVPENPVYGWVRAARWQALQKADDLPDWAKEYVRLQDQELKNIRRKYDEVSKKLATALTKAEALQAQFDAVSQAGGKLADADELPTELAGADVSDLTVREAFQRAKEEIGDDVIFLPSTEASVKKFSAYKDPSKLYRALLDVATAGRGWADDTLGKPFGEFFKERGYRYSARHPAAHNRRHRNHYEVRYNGQTVLMEAHLKVDEATSPDQCLRIYWYVDKTDKVLVVGHVGRHLPD
ncbi:hypothetical protein [Streptomyces sp. NPDC059709]|uniref:hypothetical protein n=1 Tax=Streptomyces sp. NPDC059709 TaxID=3346917 RepID=UPI0036ABFCED